MKEPELAVRDIYIEKHTDGRVMYDGFDMNNSTTSEMLAAMNDSMTNEYIFM